MLSIDFGFVLFILSIRVNDLVIMVVLVKVEMDDICVWLNISFMVEVLIGCIIYVDINMCF